MLKSKLKNLLKNYRVRKSQKDVQNKINSYFSNGKKPWSIGYEEYKYQFIEKVINSSEIILSFKTKHLPVNYGIGLDERCVEYPWIFSKIYDKSSKLLDAGSTFNFEFITKNLKIKKKELTIYTFFPEKNCFNGNRVSYVYGDLRDMYFKNESFDEIVSQSTIEHIGMDNSIYGYSNSVLPTRKSYEFLKAIREMIRILKKNGKLLVTFPFGKYENHSFFQQFDEEMLQRILDILNEKGEVITEYFLYEKTGWRFGEKKELQNIVSYNPHTGKGMLDDGAAHCRSIVCIEFKKMNL